MNFSLNVSDEAFEYLRVQKGSLDRYAGNRAEWHRRYEADIRETYMAIAPHLPTRPLHSRPMQVLDIGSGLGGIDVLIRRHFDGVPLEVNLLDGIDDPPVMNLHRETFNSMRVAKEFQTANWLAPADFRAYGKDVEKFGRRFDVVVSFGSWCFHYPPSEYLGRLTADGLSSDAVVICDVRASKPEWMADLVAAFGPARVIAERRKWFRCVFQTEGP